VFSKSFNIASPITMAFSTLTVPGASFPLRMLTKYLHDGPYDSLNLFIYLFIIKIVLEVQDRKRQKHNT